MPGLLCTNCNCKQLCKFNVHEFYGLFGILNILPRIVFGAKYICSQIRNRCTTLHLTTLPPPCNEQFNWLSVTKREQSNQSASNYASNRSKGSVHRQHSGNIHQLSMVCQNCTLLPSVPLSNVQRVKLHQIKLIMQRLHGVLDVY